EGSITVESSPTQATHMTTNDDSSFSGQMNLLLDELRATLIFLTRVPPAWIGADAAIRPDFTVAARMFPVAGALIGAAGAVVLILAWWLGLPSLVGGLLAI